MKRILKRRIVAFSSLLVLILILSSFLIKVEEKTTKVLLTNNIESGNIDFEQNDFFEKYTINCNKDIVDLKLKEDNDSLQISIDKSDIVNLYVKGETKIDLSKFSVKDSKNLFVLNFKKITLSENYVHLDFQNKSKILVFIKKKKSSYKYKVVIDPGHGGNDMGTSYGKLLEKDLNLKISKYMIDNLRYNGCDVILTRNIDKWLDLNARPEFANDENADIFVSVHINSNKSSVFNGVSTYYYNPSGLQSAEAIKLAETIQKEILKTNEWKNMGEKNENLAVLRRSKMPSVLVECGFITNEQDRDKLLQEETLVNFGLNISNGMLRNEK